MPRINYFSTLSTKLSMYIIPTKAQKYQRSGCRNKERKKQEVGRASVKSRLLDMRRVFIHDLSLGLSPSALHPSCPTPTEEQLQAVMVPRCEVSFFFGGATGNLPFLKAKANKPPPTVNSN